MLMSSDVVGELPKAIVGKLPKANRTRHASPSRSLRAKRQDTPTSFDYRDYGWVTSVKNQGKSQSPFSDYIVTLRQVRRMLGLCRSGRRGEHLPGL